MANRLHEFTTICIEEVRRNSRRVWYRISTLFVPVALLLAVMLTPIVKELLQDDGSPQGGQVAADVGLVDLAGVVRPAQAAAEKVRLFESRDSGVAAMVQKEITYLFVVADDYLLSGGIEWVHMSAGISAGFASESLGPRIERLLRSSLTEGALPPPLETRFLQPALYDARQIGDDGNVNESGRETGFISVSYIFTILLMFAMFTGGNFSMESVSDEKQNRMMEILVTSVSPLWMMAGKVAGNGILGLVQVVAWGASMAFLGPRVLSNLPDLTQVQIDPAILIWLVAFFIAGYFVMAVVMAGIGAATTSYKESSQMSVLITIPAVSPLWFFPAISGDPFGPLARALSFFPVTAPMTMMLRMGAADIPVWEVLVSLAVTIAGGMVLLWLSARVFRAGLLMYGQKMSLGKVFKALRQAS